MTSESDVGLEAAAAAEGARLHLIAEPDQRRVIADRVAQGARRQASNRDFRRELAAWLRPNRGASRDGIPGYAFGFGRLASYVVPFFVRTIDWGRGQAARDREAVERAPVVAMLATERDTPRAWMDAGQALARVLLTATAHGLSASFVNQPIEVAALRPHLQRLLEPSGFPQLLMQMGYGSAVRPTPRRPVEEVLR